MRWLVTSKKAVDRGRLEAELRACGCIIENEQPPVPLDLEEEAVEVDGPADLPERVRDSETVDAVRPSSRADPA
ncbi:MAG TPA: hypothetical protein VFG47_00495 [Geminicoccaceae bacterium]|nr:hypothetical protein [Geminicoccaceae bacterium]